MPVKIRQSLTFGGEWEICDSKFEEPIPAYGVTFTSKDDAIAFCRRMNYNFTIE